MPADALTLDDALIIGPDVVARDLEGEAVVLNLATGMYFGLDGTATRLWQLIREHGGLRRVYDEMLDEFDVDGARLEQDVLAFAGHLVSSKLATVSARIRR